jgi:heterodisulfide reductase subunit A
VLGAGGDEPRAVLLAPGADGEDGELAAQEILKLAHLLRARLPEARIVVAGGLARAPQLRRRAEALASEGVTFEDADLAPAPPVVRGSSLRVKLGSGAELDADLVVVHAAASPPEGAAALARLLHLPTDGRGFFDGRAPTPFEPTATRIAGIYVAGAAAGPRTIAQAIRDGAAAAGQVLASLVPGERRELEPLASEVDPALCGGCGICVSACPFGAVRLVAGRALVEAVHCRGCGTCAAACPTGAANARHFTRRQIAAEISALLGAFAPGDPAASKDSPARAQAARAAAGKRR